MEMPILPVSYNEIDDKDLINWLDKERKSLGVSRSALIRIKLNEIRLGQVKQVIPEVKEEKEKNKYASGFIKSAKK